VHDVDLGSLNFDQVPAGTLLHRTWVCAVLEPLRFQSVPASLRHKAWTVIRAGVVDVALWTRALAPSPASIVPPAPPESTFAWLVQPVDLDTAGTAYTDGSLIDGAPAHCGLCARLGWAFVVVNAVGTVIAAAHGVPPPWVTTILGAELWALLMAAQQLGANMSYRTDCLAVLQAYCNGHKWATASSQLYARIWVAIFQAWDGAANVDLEWMPSHTSTHDIGELHLSNGQPLTAIDRHGNAEADRLAKAAAHAVRVPEDVRERIDAEAACVTDLARWVGQVTAAASQHASGRDSAPAPRQPRAGCKQRTRPPPELRPVALGGHELVRHGRRWRCAVCRATSAAWAKLAPQCCTGSAVQRWARQAAEDAQLSGITRGSHRHRLTGDVVWCDRCGAYASVRAQGLAKACPGRPHDAAAMSRRDALRRGLHPVTRQVLDGGAVHASRSRVDRAALGVGAPVQAAQQPSGSRLAAVVARVRARIAASGQ